MGKCHFTKCPRRTRLYDELRARLSSSRTPTFYLAKNLSSELLAEVLPTTLSTAHIVSMWIPSSAGNRLRILQTSCLRVKVFCLLLITSVQAGTFVSRRAASGIPYAVSTNRFVFPP